MAFRPKIHVCSMNSRSGIADYARDFQHLVLEPEGYLLRDPEEIGREGTLQRTACYHVQLGAFQHAERRAVSRLLSVGCEQVEATIHDPPFAAFPFFSFRSALANRLSRGFDWYLRSFGLQRKLIERLARVFVLSERGRAAVLAIAPRAEVHVIPHIVNRDRVWPEEAALGGALIYFGFIGPNKGLDHALEVHARLRALRADVELHVIGQASGDLAQRYLAGLQTRYNDGVTYHGYVSDDRLDELFARAAHVILPYADYRYIVPTSGSVVHALRRGRIVWTTPANAMSELIGDGHNGFMLSMDPQTDAARIAAVLADPAAARRISAAARQTAIDMADFPYRSVVAISCSGGER